MYNNVELHIGSNPKSRRRHRLPVPEVTVPRSYQWNTIRQYRCPVLAAWAGGWCACWFHSEVVPSAPIAGALCDCAKELSMEHQSPVPVPGTGCLEWRVVHLCGHGVDGVDGGGFWGVVNTL